jgi:PAS domain S-box-containing protein
MLVINEDGNVVLINEKGCNVLGHKKEDILGKNWFDSFIPADRRKEAKEIFSGLMRAKVKEFGYAENVVIISGGEERLIAWHNTVLRDSAGRIIAVLSSGEDITDYKKAERALRESERHYRLLADNIVDFVWTADMGLRFTYASPSVKRLLGYNPEEVVGKYVGHVLTPKALSDAAGTFAKELIIEKFPIGKKDLIRARTLDLEHKRKDGSVISCEVNTTFLRDAAGKGIGVIGVTRDITSHKRAKETGKGELS